MRIVGLIVVVIALAVGMSSLRGQGAKTSKKPSDEAATELEQLMKRKLEHAQKVLEGVAVGDFPTIRKHAEDLIDISKQTEWKVLKTPKYELYSNEFRRNAADLVLQAKERNLDGAALAYVDLTLTCVKCHKHVRETRQVRLDLPDRSLPLRQAE